jgi:hypothetical protein
VFSSIIFREFADLAIWYVTHIHYLGTATIFDHIKSTTHHKLLDDIEHGLSYHNQPLCSEARIMLEMTLKAIRKKHKGMMYFAH